MRRDWPLANVEADDAHAARLAAMIFSAAPPSAPWKLFVRGTPFQLRVWRALLYVRPGTLVSYGKLAAAAGNPNASRATGSAAGGARGVRVSGGAVGGNAISYLIPCHRVIRETGISGHYRWGAVRKRAILAWEAGRHA
jgi:AraC family transcriptional regulator of adaptative response/methylated-DNA-[protein]-cysteine methyltransferase